MRSLVTPGVSWIMDIFFSGKRIQQCRFSNVRPAYNGNNEFYDDLALASVALLYATGKTVYADDALRSKDLVNGQTFGDGAGFFEGGWFATNDKGFFKNAKKAYFTVVFKVKDAFLRCKSIAFVV